MPWKETCAMDERMKFLEAWAAERRSVTELCEAFGVTRQTAYKWIRRWLAEGPAGLSDRSRAPHTSPTETSDDVVRLLLGLKQRHPLLGPKKLVKRLAEERPDLTVPAASTAGTILKRHGLVKERRRRQTAKFVHTTSTHFRSPSKPNEVWQADFKGEFKLKDGTWCWPLTITDAFSRFLVRCVGLTSPCLELAMPVFDDAFQELGLPNVIHTDNGSPFACSSGSGLTVLSSAWVVRGIAVERSRPAKPQDNGRHERFHRTLKEATVVPPAENLAAQQVRFDLFRNDYNNLRPHEALGQEPPARHYSPSARRLGDAALEVEYPPHWDTRIVDRDGQVRLGDATFRVGAGLRGRRIGIDEFQLGHYRCHLSWLALGEYDENADTFAFYGSQSPTQNGADRR